MKRSLAHTVIPLTLALFAWLVQAQPVQVAVRVGFRNELPVPVLIRDLSQPFRQPIRLVPKETVWDRLPANTRIPIAVHDATSGQLLAKTVLTVPATPSVLFVIQIAPTGNTIVSPQPAP